MEMLLKMNQKNGQVGSGCQGATVPIPRVCLLGGTFGFWRRGINSYSGANFQKTAYLSPYYELSICEADGPSVKCSGAPLFPGGFNGGLKG